MAPSKNSKSKSKSSKTTDDFDITKFPEVDMAFIATIWKEEHKHGYFSNPRTLTSLIGSIEADISTANEGLDSFTCSEASSSLTVAEQNPDGSSAGDVEMSVGCTSYQTIGEIVKRIEDRGAKEKAGGSEARRKWETEYTELEEMPPAEEVNKTREI